MHGMGIVVGRFVETLGYNPMINLFRFFTPKMRTVDEHPLKYKDLKILSDMFEVKSTFYGFFSLISLFFLKTKYFKRINGWLNKLDSYVLKIPIFNLFAWVIIIELTNGKAQTEVKV